MTIEHKTQESQLVVTTREHFIKTMEEGNPTHNWFTHHVKQVEKWALKISDYYSNVNKEVILVSVWLHDIGQEKRENFAIHEILSETESKRFLTSLDVDEETIEKVAHCVRTHRCKEDALPETDEAKILAAADSASHLTDIVYIHMLNDGCSKKQVFNKLERDIRDVLSLPKPLLDELLPLQSAWKQLIEAFPETR